MNPWRWSIESMPRRGGGLNFSEDIPDNTVRIRSQGVIAVSKPSAPRILLPAGSIVAVALVAAIAIAGVLAICICNRQSDPARLFAGETQWPMSEAEPRRQFRGNLDALPLSFEVNRGQTDPRINYLARAGGYTLFLTAQDAVFALRSSSQPAAKETAPKSDLHRTTLAASRGCQEDLAGAIRLHLSGGNPRAQIAAGHQLPGRSNYFIGNDPREWRTDVPQYARVSYRNVYPGVSLAFYGVQRQLEFDFIVAPGASPAPIRLGVSGADGIAHRRCGESCGSHRRQETCCCTSPSPIRRNDGARHPVEARFVLTALTMKLVSE